MLGTVRSADLCRGTVVRGVVQGGVEAWLVGQTRVLALDGMMLVCVAAVVVAARVSEKKVLRTFRPDKI